MFILAVRKLFFLHKATYLFYCYKLVVSINIQLRHMAFPRGKFVATRENSSVENALAKNCYTVENEWNSAYLDDVFCS